VRRVAVSLRFDHKAAPYFRALSAAGCEPVGVTPAHPIDSIEGFHGLVLTGGTDVSPSLYGEATHPQTEPADAERDQLDLRLLRDALDRRLPVLAICRGMQMFNVAHGGTLLQHIEGHAVRSSDPAEPAHAAIIEPGSKLDAIMGNGPHPVNSRHHQAVGRVGDALRVAATAPDGIIEALERPDYPFALAVQWHPEDQVERFETQRKLFEAFARAL
jgi:putative glutamine amidotransferase